VPSSERAVVVTGGSRGVGRGIAGRLAGDGWHVVVLDATAPDEAWPEGTRIEVVVGNAAHVAVAERAADLAAASGTLAGWVNNAAVFADAGLADPDRVVEAITANIAMAVVGCSVAVARFRAAGTAGSVVNVSATRRSGPYAARSRTRRPRPPSRV
jgi:NAD(P)-dependent dehydrogenase (short-subunit alcohol dehydrogenase family)